MILSLILISGFFSSINFIIKKQYIMSTISLILSIACVLLILSSINKENKTDDDINKYKKIAKIIWIIYLLLILTEFILIIIPFTESFGFITIIISSIIFTLSYCDINSKLYKNNKLYCFIYLGFTIIFTLLLTCGYFMISEDQILSIINIKEIYTYLPLAILLKFILDVFISFDMPIAF